MIYVNRIRATRLEQIAKMATNEGRAEAYRELIAEEMADFEADVQVRTPEGDIPLAIWSGREKP